MIVAIVTIVTPIVTALSLFDAQEPRVRAGNEAYLRGEYDAALKSYDAAMQENPPSPELHFDRGNALYKLSKPDEALEEYKKALDTRDAKFKESDYYNLGNTLGALKKYPEAIESYKRALELDPNDQEAKYNLELLLRAQEEQKKQKNQQGDKKDDKDSKKQDEQKKEQEQAKQDEQKKQEQQQKEQQAKQDEPKKEQEQQAQQQQKEQQQKQQEQQQQQAAEEKAQANGEPKPLTKRDAERILDALKADEKDLQMWQLQAKERKPRSLEKDW